MNTLFVPDRRSPEAREARPALSHPAFLLLITCLTAGHGFNRFNGLGSRWDAAIETLLARRDNAAAPAGVARPGVVDADEGRGAKAGAEDGFLLGAEQVEPRGQEPHHLALRDRKAGSGQHGHDPLAPSVCRTAASCDGL
jgi:hypothetical protein